MMRLRIRAALLTAVGALAGANPTPADDAVPLPPPVAAPACPVPAPPCVAMPVTPVPFGAAPAFNCFPLAAGTPIPCPKPVAADMIQAAPAGASLVYKLRNAAAADVADALTKFCCNQKRELSIVAEPVSNSLLVSASAEYLTIVASLIDKLDQEPPQVRVDVMVVRVPADFAAKAGLRTAGEADGMACELTAREKQMFTALLQQAKQDGRAGVLACPRLMVLDNQTGQFHVGGYHAHTIPAADGKPERVERMPVGVTAKMMPRISPDGRVLLRLEVTNSQPTPQLDLGNGVSAPAFNVETVETTANLSNGATAVYGGVVAHRYVKHLVATPVLGNIPHLDKFFTNVVVSTEKSELLLVVTAHVVRPTAALAAPVARPVPAPPMMMPATPVSVLRPAPMPPTAVVTAPRVPASTPPPLPTPAPCCDAACGSAARAKAAELVASYRKMCAAGDLSAATRCAVQALAIDPACFAPSR